MMMPSDMSPAWRDALRPAWTPANIIERKRFEEGERLNAASVRKRLAEEAAQTEPTEGASASPFIPTEAHARHLAALASDRAVDIDVMQDEDRDAQAAALAEEFDRRREVEAELSELHQFRESTWVRHCRNRTGEVMTPEQFAKMRAQQAQLEEDTIELALRLEAADRPALGTGPQTFMVGVLTGDVQPVINVRKRAILPTVAAEKRAPMIRALEALLWRPDHRFDQFATFTLGRRVPIDPVSAGWELRQSFADPKTGLHRRISKLNAEPFMGDYGAQIIFRASEIGSLKDDHGELKRDDQGRVTAHPHAHCLIHFSRWLVRDHDDLLGKGPSAARKKLGRPLRIKRHRNGSALMVWKSGRVYVGRDGAIFKTTGEMGEWTRRVWAFWGAHWSIDGALEKVREACKYPVKPADIKALSNAELAALDIALFKLRRVETLGELREVIRYRREYCLAVRKEWRREDGERVKRPVVLPDWNARKRDRKETLAQKRRKRLRAKLAKIKKRASKRLLEQVNRDRRAEWQKVHADFIERHGQGDLFRPAPEAPAMPADLDELPPEYRSDREKAVGKPCGFRNRIVARLAPAFYFGPVSQPAIMVWSDRKPTADDVRAMLGQHFIAPAVEATRAQFAEAANAAQVSVHTSPVTVRGQTPVLPALLRPSTWRKTALPVLC